MATVSPLMAPEIPNLPPPGYYRKVLIYGPSGVGKTVLTGTANFDARCTPTLFLDFDRGSASLFGSGIKVVTIEDWDQYSYVLTELNKPDPDEYKYYYKDGNPAKGLLNPKKEQPAGCIYDQVKWSSLVIDSITETHTYSLQGTVEKRVRNLLAKNKEVDNPDRLDINIVEYADVGKALNQMRRFLRTYRDLPMHILVTALAGSKILPKEGTVILPALTGQLAEESVSMYDVCAYMAIINDKKSADLGKRVLVLGNTPGIRAKVRTPWGKTVPDSLMEPTITKLFDELQVPVLGNS